MAKIQEIIDYSKANPNTDYAKRAQQLIQKGSFDDQAIKEGVDLSWGSPSFQHVKNKQLTNEQPSYMQNVESDWAKNFSEGYPAVLGSMEKHLAQSKLEPGHPLESIRNLVTGGTGLASDAYKALGIPFKGVVDSVTNIPAVQKFAMEPPVSTILTGFEDLDKKLGELEKTHPHTAEFASNLLTVILGTLGAEQASKVDLGKLQHIVNKETVRVGGEITQKAGEVVSGTGRLLKAGAQKLYEHAITPNVEESQQLLDYRAKEPFLTRIKRIYEGTDNPPQTRGSTAMEQGIAGTEEMVGVRGKRISDKIWKETVKPALDESKGVMSKEEMFSPIEKRISETIEPTKRAAYQDAYDYLKDAYKDRENFTMTEAQSIKSQIDTFTPDKVWKGKPIANELKTLNNDMANGIRTKIYGTLGPEVQQAYADWGNLHELEQVGIKAISDAPFKGGAGAMVKGLWDTATTPIKTYAGKILYRVGDAFEFVGDKGIKTFGEYLESKGFEPPLPIPNIGNSNANKPQNSPSNNEINHDSIISNQSGSVKEPTITVGNKTLNLKQVHSQEGYDLFKTLSPEDQIKFSNFDKVNSQIEMFAKNPQEFPLYRGENAINKGGLHFTTDPAYAKNFGENAVTKFLPEGSKVYKLTGQEFADALSKGVSKEIDVWKPIFDKGYDAIVGTDSMNGQAVDVIVNPKHLK